MRRGIYRPDDSIFEDPRRAPRRSWGRLILVAVVICLLLGGAVLLLAPRLIRLAPLQKRLFSRFEQATGLVLVAAPPELSLWGGVGLKLRAVRVALPSERSRPFLEIGTVRLLCRVWPLIVHRRFDLAGVRVESPRLRLIRAPDGSGWRPAPGALLARGDLLERIRLEEAVVLGGRVELEIGGARWILDRVGLELDDLVPGRTARLRGRLALPGADRANLSFRLTLGPLEAGRALISSRSRLDLELEGGPGEGLTELLQSLDLLPAWLQLRGELPRARWMTSGPLGALSGELQLDAGSTRLVLGPLLAKPSGVPLRYRGPLRLEQGGFQLAGGELVLGESRGTLECERGRGGRSRVVLELPELQLADLSGLLPGGGEWASRLGLRGALGIELSAGTAREGVRFTLEADLTAAGMALPPWLDKPPGERLVLGLRGRWSGRRIDDLAGRLDLLGRSLSCTGRVEDLARGIGQVQLKGGGIEAVQLARLVPLLRDRLRAGAVAVDLRLSREDPAVGPVRVTGTVALSGGELAVPGLGVPVEALELTVRLGPEGIRFNPLSARMGQTTLRGGLELLLPAPPRVVADLTIDRLTPRELTLIRDLLVTLSADSRPEISPESMGPLLPPWVLEGRLRVGELDVGPFTLGQLRCAVAVDDRGIGLRQLHAAAWQGAVTAEGFLALDRSPPAVTLQGELRRVALEELLFSGEEKPLAAGTLEARYRFRRRGGVEAIRGPELELEGRLLEARLPLLALDELPGEIAATLGSARPWDLTGALGSGFPEVRFQARWTREGWRTEYARLSGPQFVLEVSGSVDPELRHRHRADLLLEAPLARRLIPNPDLRRALRIPDGRVLLPLRFAGRGARTSLRIDLARMAQGRAAEIGADLQELAAPALLRGGAGGTP